MCRCFNFFLQSIPDLLSHKNLKGDTLLQFTQRIPFDYISESVNVILAHKPDIGGRDRCGNNTLHIAAKSASRAVIVDVLANCVSNVHEKNVINVTPIDVAVERNDRDIIAIFLPYMTTDKAIHCNTTVQIQVREFCNDPICSVLLPNLTDIVQDYLGLHDPKSNTKKRPRTRDTE